MGQLISKRYAKALFDVACEKNQVDEFLEDVQVILELFKADPNFIRVINHPSIILSEKMSIIENSLKNKVKDDIIGLFAIVFRKSRQNEIIDIFEMFVKLVEAYQNKVTAYVTSAITLSDEQISNIKVKLMQKLNKQIVVVSKVDSSLLAGLKIEVEGKLFDASAKSQFDTIKKILLNKQLA